MAEQSRPDWNEVHARLVARAWKDEAFKEELLHNPKAVLERELGTELPEDVRVQALEQPRDTLYLVLPEAPALTEGMLSDEELEAAVGGRIIPPDNYTYEYTYRACGCRA